MYASNHIFLQEILVNSTSVMQAPFVLFFVIYNLLIYSNSKSVPEGYYYRSDVIVTKWPTTSKIPLSRPDQKVSPSQGGTAESGNEPGWMRKQLLKFGQVASKIGNSMGGHANKITVALDKICEVVKTVIPLLAAVCHVGQFGFCSATDEAPLRLSEAMNPNDLDLDSLDR